MDIDNSNNNNNNNNNNKNAEEREEENEEEDEEDEVRKERDKEIQKLFQTSTWSKAPLEMDAFVKYELLQHFKLQIDSRYM